MIARASATCIRRLAPAAAMIMLGAAAAPAWSPPAPAADLKAAMDAAATGSPEALTALADSGRADAQVYAGILYVFGRGKVAANPPRGCAYAAKAAETRPDAMHLKARCLQLGLSGPPDPPGAEAAYIRASDMGYLESKCALGQMLLARPDTAKRGLALCEAGAEAGDDDASLFLGKAYLDGVPLPKDPKAGRKWYELAAKQNPAMAARKLGELYAAGEGGRAEPKKALAQWIAAEKAGDKLACILVADQLFSQITGGRKPGPGTYAFRGGVPVADIGAVETWYEAARDNDPRPDVKKRAEYALAILKSFKTASVATPP